MEAGFSDKVKKLMEPIPDAAKCCDTTLAEDFLLEKGDPTVSETLAKRRQQTYRFPGGTIVAMVVFEGYLVVATETEVWATRGSNTGFTKIPFIAGT